MFGLFVRQHEVMYNKVLIKACFKFHKLYVQRLLAYFPDPPLLVSSQYGLQYGLWIWLFNWQQNLNNHAISSEVYWSTKDTLGRDIYVDHFTYAYISGVDKNVMNDLNDKPFIMQSKINKLRCFTIY